MFKTEWPTSALKTILTIRSNKLLDLLHHFNLKKSLQSFSNRKSQDADGNAITTLGGCDDEYPLETQADDREACKEELSSGWADVSI